jgi:hypothetical protein
LGRFLGFPEANKAYNENVSVSNITNSRWVQRESTIVAESSNQTLSSSVGIFGFNENKENDSP